MPSSPRSTPLTYTTLFRPYRYSELDFKAASHDGFGEDWPLSYDDVAPYYDIVEDYVGITGIAEGVYELPDSKFHPPMGMRCVEDRKSTRLNSSHLGISYAVFTTFYPPHLHDALPTLPLFGARLQGRIARRVRRGLAALLRRRRAVLRHRRGLRRHHGHRRGRVRAAGLEVPPADGHALRGRSEEHTSELQSLRHLVCRLHHVLPPSPTRRSSDLTAIRSSTSRPHRTTGSARTGRSPTTTSRRTTTSSRTTSASRASPRACTSCRTRSSTRRWACAAWKIGRAHV